MNECCICLEELGGENEENTELLCKHKIHKMCFENLQNYTKNFNISLECPLCRHEIELMNVVDEPTGEYENTNEWNYDYCKILQTIICGISACVFITIIIIVIL